MVGGHAPSQRTDCHSCSTHHASKAASLHHTGHTHAHTHTRTHTHTHAYRACSSAWHTCLQPLAKKSTTHPCGFACNDRAGLSYICSAFKLSKGAIRTCPHSAAARHGWTQGRAQVQQVMYAVVFLGHPGTHAPRSSRRRRRSVAGGALARGRLCPGA